MGLYTFDQHKTEGLDEKKELEELTFLMAGESGMSVVEQSIELATTITEGVILARDLTNQPANYLTPTILAERAQAIAEEEAEFNHGDAARPRPPPPRVLHCRKRHRREAH